MKVLIDTNAYSHLLDGDQSVRDLLSRATKVYVSSIVLGELQTGFKCGSKDRKNREMLDRFLSKSTVEVVDVTAETAEVYASIMDSLRKIGKPIPTNDVWIAAHATEVGAAVLTFDKHFTSIPGLRLALS